MPRKAMTPDQYRKLRERIGTQQEAGEVLGVHRVTIADRERGAERITVEAGRAMRDAVREVEEKGRTATEETDGLGRGKGQNRNALRRGGRKALQDKES